MPKVPDYSDYKERQKQYAKPWTSMESITRAAYWKRKEDDTEHSGRSDMIDPEGYKEHHHRSTVVGYNPPPKTDA